MEITKISSKIIEVKTRKKGAIGKEEKVLATDVKLPDDCPARMKVLRAEGKKWYLTIVYLPNSEDPFALFCTTNSHEKSAQVKDAVYKLLELARKKGILEEHITELEHKIGYASNVDKLTRSISLLLRHGIAIVNIVAVLDSMDGVFVGSFLFQIKKFLSQYIKEGESVAGAVCSNCGSENVIYSEGCTMCADCGSSKCG